MRVQNPPYPWDGAGMGMLAATTGAARQGHLHVLQWLRAQDPPCSWNIYTCSFGAMSGRLDLLQWMLAQDPPCPCDEETCSEAARNGHLELLQWLRAQDPPCPWDANTCSLAALNGHLELLQWLREGDGERNVHFSSGTFFLWLKTGLLREFKSGHGFEQLKSQSAHNF
jgi:hypothetical protein